MQAALKNTADKINSEAKPGCLPTKAITPPIISAETPQPSKTANIV
jgi:hypothetical protein